ncbi:MAG: antibiotic biosynthesis monooxygenase [bacterium]|nr:antibiotic biosynthesis monooxygenase [bacterium]
MSKVTMIGKIMCQDGQGEAMEAVFADMAEACKDESGTEIYTYLRGEENTYWFFALMSSQEAMQSHGQGDAMKQAMAAFGPLMASPPEMSVTSPVAANGFDF